MCFSGANNFSGHVTAAEARKMGSTHDHQLMHFYTFFLKYVYVFATGSNAGFIFVQHLRGF